MRASPSGTATALSPGRHLLRWLKRLALALGVLLVLFYGGMLAVMYFTERTWLGDPPFHAAIDAQADSPQALTLIDSGAQALAYRLRLIASAERTLELEYFIYDLDRASRVVTQALAERAAAGVQVRVLVDFSLPVLALRPAYAHALRDAGIEVRYYNTASVARLFSVQHRTHRKMLIVDDRAAIIGGRNIADEYFDLSPDYNFLDSDALVEGNIVPTLRESFDLYWHSPWTREPDLDDDSGTLAEVTSDQVKDTHREAQTFLSPTAADLAVAQAASALPAELPQHRCPKLRFVTDYPGLAMRNRQVYTAIVELLEAAEDRVFAESPYFLLRGEGLTATQALAARGVDLRVLTNSLYSTDAYYTVGPLYFSLEELAPSGMTLLAYQGAPPVQRWPGFAGSARWGVHAKRAVIDDDTILLGTYNVDPRSANLNSELMIVCSGNQELAAQMADDLEARMSRAQPVVQGGDQVRSALLGNATLSERLVMMLVAPVASAFDILL